MGFYSQSHFHLEHECFLPELDRSEDVISSEFLPMLILSKITHLFHSAAFFVSALLVSDDPAVKGCADKHHCALTQLRVHLPWWNEVTFAIPDVMLDKFSMDMFEEVTLMIR